MADLGVRDFLQRRRARAARLQIDSRRAVAVAGAFGRERAHHGISGGAPVGGCDREEQRVKREAGVCHRGAGKRRSRRCAALGRNADKYARAGVCAAQTQRSRDDRLFVRHRRAAEGLHDEARQLSRAVRRAHFAVSVRAGISLPQHSADESRDRFHGGILWPVHLRRRGRAFANAAAGICARGVSEIQDHLRQPRAAGAEEFAKRIAGALRRFDSWQTACVRYIGRRQ